MSTVEGEPISVSCRKCNQGFRVKAKAAGRSVKCPACAVPVRIPEPSKQDERNSFDFGDPFQLEAVDDDVPASNFAANDPPPLPEPQQTERRPEVTEMRPEANAYAPTLTAAPAAASQSIVLPLTRSYPVLEITALICRWLGYIVLVIAAAFILISFALAVFTGLRTDAGLLPSLGLWLFGSIPTALGALFAAGVLIMNAEMIQLGMHVQANTLATAHAVRR